MSEKGRMLFIISALSFTCLAGLFFALEVWMPFMWIILVMALGTFLGWAWLDQAKIFGFLTLKSTKQSLNMGTLIFFTLLFLITINFLALRYSKSYDFSSNELNSLSEQSKSIAQSLDKELQVKFFYKSGLEKIDDLKKQAYSLVKLYQEQNRNIKFDYVEINQQPSLTAEYAVSTGAGETYIEYNNKRNKVENLTEQDLTNAIIKLTRPSKKIIYFLTGHGERSLDDQKSDIGLASYGQMLQKNSYEVKQINLLDSGIMPLDVDVLVVAGPKQQFQKTEIEIISNYLKKGGSIFFMLEHGVDGFLKDLLTKLGLKLSKNYVYNVLSTQLGQVVNANTTTAATSYSPHSLITKNFANQMTIFRNPSYLSFEEKPSIKHEELVYSAKNSVELEALDSKDYLGEPKSFNFATLVYGELDGSTKSFQVVAVADADFLSNVLLYQNLNRDLGLNITAYLAKETDLISVSAKEPLITKMLVSVPEFNQFFKFTFAGFIIPLPFVFMIISILFWFRRRQL